LDISAISKTVRRRLKEKIKGKSQYGNIEWKNANFEWYNKIHDGNFLLHENFVKYLKEKNDVKTVLEVGCGAGIYAIKNRELFNGLSYTGLDISKEAIEHCKKNSNFNFICADLIKMDIIEKYDLVYSHAVVDHVYDIDTFISKLCSLCRKYAYINAYRGYFPELKKHRMTWRDDDSCYYNDISPIQISEVLLKNDLKEDEFVIRPQESGFGYIQTVIEIARKH
jgi:SAM-dependent methyltransferase